MLLQGRGTVNSFDTSEKGAKVSVIQEEIGHTELFVQNANNIQILFQAGGLSDLTKKAAYRQRL